ncbi:hypothetical protein ACFL5X_04180, partial [Candidatus Omnitrophota bacterium]
EAVKLLAALFAADVSGEDQPFISTFLQEGSVRFNIVAANPSKVKSQQVPVKVYLPQEVESKDILELGGLDLEFDTQQSLYYVYKDTILLGPGQTKIFEVRVEDIWLIDEKELKALEDKIEYLVTMFEASEYAERMKEIAERGLSLIKYIDTSQKDESLTRSQHIGVFRSNRMQLTRLEDEIWEMERILQQIRGPLTPRMLAKTKIKTNAPTKTATWIAIFSMVFFLAVLSAVVFFTWYRQSKTTDKVIADTKRAVYPEFEDRKEKR